jgi:hypothetical protein
MTTVGDKPERKDCIVKLNCVEVRAVPLSLRGDIHPLHKAYLEIIEEKGKDGTVSFAVMREELNKRGFKI